MNCFLVPKSCRYSHGEQSIDPKPEANTPFLYEAINHLLFSDKYLLSHSRSFATRMRSPSLDLALHHKGPLNANLELKLKYKLNQTFRAQSFISGYLSMRLEINFNLKCLCI